MNKIMFVKEIIIEHKKKIILGISGLVLLSLLTIGFIYFKNNKQSNTIVYEPVLKENKEIKEEPKEILYIDIKGYVNNPGVYAIEKGKRVVDAINQAGGLSETANTSLLNLSMLLDDQMVIIVYSNSEIKNITETIKKEQQQETLCTNNVVNNACISTSKSIVVPEIKENNSSSETKEKDSSNIDISSEKININKASKEILMTLSKIGESKAKSIIEYREKNGGFKAIEEIKNVNGIGDSLFEAIKDFITI